MKKTIWSIVGTLVLLAVLVFGLVPDDTLNYVISNAKDNKNAIATAMAPTETSTPLPSATPTVMLPPTELGPNPTDVMPEAQATAGIPTISPTQQLRLEDLPPWGDNPDMMKYREALAASSKVNELAYLVTGSRSACFVGENKERLIDYSFKPPQSVSAVLGLVGIDLPDVVTLNFDSEVHTSTTVCGAALFGIRMDDLINTSTVAGTGTWEPTGTAAKRINPDTGKEELFQIFEQPADFQAQPTICLVGVHVNGQIINDTYNQPGVILRALFPYDMGAQFAIDFERAWQQFLQPSETQQGAEVARESLVSGKAHAALCAFLDLVDGGASRLNSCNFLPRIPQTVQYCGDMEVPDLVLPTLQTP